MKANIELLGFYKSNLDIVYHRNSLFTTKFQLF